MIPTIDKKATGINIRRTMDKQNISVKDLQKHLGLNSLQSIYHWLNGICLPTVDNLYALSDLFHLPVDELICGSRASLKDFETHYCNISNHALWKRTEHGIWWQLNPISRLGLFRMINYKNKI